MLKAAAPAEVEDVEDVEEDRRDVVVGKSRTFVVQMEEMHLVDFLRNKNLKMKCFIMFSGIKSFFTVIISLKLFISSALFEF